MTPDMDIIEKYQSLLKKKGELEVSASSLKAVLDEKESQLKKYLAEIKESFGVDSLDDLKKLYADELIKLEGIVKKVEEGYAAVESQGV